MANKIEELKKDIAELEILEKHASRSKVKDIISIEIRKLVLDLVKFKKQTKTTVSATNFSSIPSSSTIKKYEVKVNTYSWDQTDKYVKFYVSLKNVHTIPPEKVKCEFTTKSLELTVEDLDNKDYVLKIINLLKTIDPKESNWKVKSDMILINVAKTNFDTWSHVTEWEKKTAHAKKPDVDTDKVDPSEGLMSLMKNMYDKGDDELKRTIAKAWTESQSKPPKF